MPQMDVLTLAQAEATVEALHAMGSIHGAADALRIKKSACHKRVKRIRALAVRTNAYEGKVALPPERVVDNAPAPEPEPPAPVPANDEPAAKPKAEPYRIGGSPADREITKLRDDNRRLRQSLEDCHRDALGEDEVRRMIGVLSQPSDAPPAWLTGRPQKHACRSPETAVCCWSDWHLVEVVSLDETAGVNEYSVPIAHQRFQRVVESTIEVAREHGPGGRGTPYSGIVVNLVGDLVSGGLHPELAKSDEETLLQSILTARDMLIGGLTRMADEFGSVYAPAVAGNHGRTTHKPEFKGYAHKNADWLVYQLAQRHFDAVGDKRIRLDVRPSNDVYYRVHNTRYMLTHGDMLGVKGGDGIIGSIGPISRVRSSSGAPRRARAWSTTPSLWGTGTSPCGSPASSSPTA